VKDKIYVAFYEHGMDDELLNFHIYSRVIIPEVIEVRRKLGHLPMMKIHLAAFRSIRMVPTVK
jgi:hypothetical protein